MSVGECKLAAPNDVSNIHQRNYNSTWQVAQSSCSFIMSVTIILYSLQFACAHFLSL